MATVRNFGKRNNIQVVYYTSFTVLQDLNIREKAEIKANSEEKYASVLQNGITGMFKAFSVTLDRNTAWIESGKNQIKIKIGNQVFSTKIAGVHLENFLKPGNEDETVDILVLTDGESRLTAVYQAVANYPEKAENFWIRTDSDPEFDAKNPDISLSRLGFSMLDSNESRRLTGYAEGVAFSRAINAGMTKAEIAARRGCSEMHVSNMLTLVQGGEKIAALISEGIVKPTTAVKAIRTYGGDQAATVIKEVKESNPDAVTVTEAMMPEINQRGKRLSGSRSNGKNGKTPEAAKNTAKTEETKSNVIQFKNPIEPPKPVKEPSQKELLPLWNAAKAIKESNTFRGVKDGTIEVVVNEDEWIAFVQVMEGLEKINF